MDTTQDKTFTKRKISFFKMIKDSFKSNRKERSFPWLQSGFLLVGFTLGVLVTSSVDLLSRMDFSNTTKQSTSTDEADECRAKGGSYDTDNEICILNTSDNESECTDNTDCEGWCLANEESELGNEEAGYCSDKFRPDGCFKFIDKGKVNSICLYD